MGDEADEWDSLNAFMQKEGSIHQTFPERVYSSSEDEEELLVVDPLLCPTCDIGGELYGGQITCRQCGMKRSYVKNMRNYIVDSNNYNVSEEIFMSFKLVGKNAYYNNRSLMRTCSSYAAYSRNQILKEVLEKNFQYHGKKIPKDVINLAIDIFTTIKNSKLVFRGNGKWGVVGACMFYACAMKGVTKTPREISNVIDVEEKFISQGDRILQDLNEKGVIEIPTFIQPLQDYIKQYFAALYIPDKYTQFIIDLIDRAEKKYIHIMHDSRLTTKCVGAILMLVTRVKELRHIDKDMLCAECNISKSTFTRYYNLLRSNHKKLRKVFKKHQIPMENEWRKQRT